MKRIDLNFNLIGAQFSLSLSNCLCPFTVFQSAGIKIQGDAETGSA